MKKIGLVAIMVLVILSLSACVAGPNALEDTPGARMKPAGFLLGLWHGFISLFTFVISLFSKRVGVYEVYNSGGWYDFGFILGILMFYGGGGSGSCRARR